MNFNLNRGKVVQHLLVIAAAFLVMKPSLARADDSTKGSGSAHRLIFGAGFGEDWAHRSDYGEIWVPTPSARAMYLYRPVNHFDVGADACLYFWTEGPGTIFVPRVAARGFVPVTSSDGVVELGFTLSAGASIGNYNGRTPVAFSLALGPDVRTPISSKWSLQIAAEAAAVQGEMPTINDYSPLLVLGGWLGLVTVL